MKVQLRIQTPSRELTATVSNGFMLWDYIIEGLKASTDGKVEVTFEAVTAGDVFESPNVTYDPYDPYA